MIKSAIVLGYLIYQTQIKPQKLDLMRDQNWYCLMDAF